MNVVTLLDELESAGLVRPEPTAPEPEYAFRHGLLQDTAYQLLLRQERAWLHQRVGEVLEDCYPERSDELAALLGKHFLLGGDRPRALRYLRLAGDSARGRYANVEALEAYSSALEVARQLERPLDRADLCHRRGLLHEIVGDFESARADLEAALSLAQEEKDRGREWRALIDLGELWAAKDYEKTGEYFNEALRMAREIGDEAVVARSLNRLANWHINLGDGRQAKRDHQEALAIFERLEDKRGMAETLDFLGMTSMMSSDPIGGADYYQRAIPLLRQLADKQRLASALTSYSLRIGNTLSETVVGVEIDEQEALANLEEALQLTRELGWRSGEAYALCLRSFLANSLARFDLAVSSGREAFQLAQEANHVQWMTASSCALGRAHLEMFGFERALELAEQSWQLANRTGSRHWIGITTGTLARALMAAGDNARAERALADYPGGEPEMEMLGDRLYWTARAELWLARGQHPKALDVLDPLIEAAPGFSEGKVIPLLFRDRGLAYWGLDQRQACRQQLRAALDRCQKQGLRSLQWKLHANLARLARQMGEERAAQKESTAGHELLKRIADWMPDSATRERFLSGAHAQMDS